MLGLAEYVAASADLAHLARSAESDIAAQLTKETTAQQARSIAISILPRYTTTYRELLKSTMDEVAHNAVHYYANELSIQADQELADQIVQKQYTDKYYGLTLNQRLAFNERKLSGRVTKSSFAGPQHVAKVLTGPIFGAHYNTDRRTLQGTLVKIENDAARAVAVKGNVSLIRWTLSHRHIKPDDCDDLASYIDQGVVDYLSENDWDLNPKGLYFVADLPQPPHPNCQCEYLMVTKEGTEHRGVVQRAFNRVISVLRRLRQR